jgi:hypothetical protein
MCGEFNGSLSFGALGGGALELRQLLGRRLLREQTRVLAVQGLELGALAPLPGQLGLQHSGG